MKTAKEEKEAMMQEVQMPKSVKRKENIHQIKFCFKQRSEMEKKRWN